MNVKVYPRIPKYALQLELADLETGFLKKFHFFFNLQTELKHDIKQKYEIADTPKSGRHYIFRPLTPTKRPIPDFFQTSCHVLRSDLSKYRYIVLDSISYQT